MTIQTITATEAARAFSELLNRVRYAHQSFVILRGGERVARIEPATAPTAPTAPTGSELDRLLADAIPHLGMDEAACFDADIQAARAQLDGSERSWD
ncbi:MAG: hypothetical protein P9E88_05070 [Candidatus Competibacter sp.]|jgi:antitoxin (DNA-binding transcriptional repressor) of toxin-antitoxin stability system|nr:hypothetical protein [Candidatus Competibacter sp.]